MFAWKVQETIGIGDENLFQSFKTWKELHMMWRFKGETIGIDKKIKLAKIWVTHTIYFLELSYLIWANRYPSIEGFHHSLPNNCLFHTIYTCKTSLYLTSPLPNSSVGSSIIVSFTSISLFAIQRSCWLVYVELEHYWKCNSPKNPHVRLSVGWFGRLHLHAPFRALLYYLVSRI